MAKSGSKTATAPPAGSAATTPRNDWIIAMATAVVVLVGLGLGAGPAEAAKRHHGGAGKAAAQTAQAALASTPTITISRDMASDLPPVAPRLHSSMVSPLAGEFAVSSAFGWRKNPFGYGLELHPGIDLVAAAGTPIRSVMAGTIAAVGPNGGYGLAVDVIGHDGSTVRYGHMRKTAVKIGQRVAAGAVLGQVGSTGRSTGPHLHFEVRRDDHPITPVPLLRQALAGGGEVERRVLASLDSAGGRGKGRDRAERVLVASAEVAGHGRSAGLIKSGRDGSGRSAGGKVRSASKGSRQLAAVCAAGGGGYLCGSTKLAGMVVGGGP